MTQDTGADSLSDRHTRFVDEYLRTGNASQAARSAGFAARSGAGLLEVPAIKAELEKCRPERATKATDTGDLQKLIAEADSVLATAKDAGNVPGAVAALTLKSRLLGVLHGNELADAGDAPKPPQEVDIQRLALTICNIMREALGSSHFCIVAPGEVILRVKDPDRLPEVLNLIGEAEPAIPLEDVIRAKLAGDEKG